MTPLAATVATPATTWHSRMCCCAASPRGVDPQSKTRLRLTLGLRRRGGRWVVSHEHHSFCDTTPDDVTRRILEALSVTEPPPRHPEAVRPPQPAALSLRIDDCKRLVRRDGGRLVTFGAVRNGAGDSAFAEGVHLRIIVENRASVGAVVSRIDLVASSTTQASSPHPHCSRCPACTTRFRTRTCCQYTSTTSPTSPVA